MKTREYYLYGVNPKSTARKMDNRTPVVFEFQPDGGLPILRLDQDKRVVPDSSLYGLIHFDRDNLAHKVSLKQFQLRLSELGVAEIIFEEAIKAVPIAA